MPLGAIPQRPKQPPDPRKRNQSAGFATALFGTGRRRGTRGSVFALEQTPFHSPKPLGAAAAQSPPGPALPARGGPVVQLPLQLLSRQRPGDGGAAGVENGVGAELAGPLVGGVAGAGVVHPVEQGEHEVGQPELQLRKQRQQHSP